MNNVLDLKNSEISGYSLWWELKLQIIVVIFPQGKLILDFRKYDKGS